MYKQQVLYPGGMQAMSRRLLTARRRYPMGNRSGILCEENGKLGRQGAKGRREEKQREDIGRKRWHREEKMAKG